jgi:hypothetical protein
VLLENLLRDHRTGHGEWPTTIEGKVCDHLADLLRRNTIVERAIEMTLELRAAIKARLGPRI